MAELVLQQQMVEAAKERSSIAKALLAIQHTLDKMKPAVSKMELVLDKLEPVVNDRSAWRPKLDEATGQLRADVGNIKKQLSQIALNPGPTAIEGSNLAAPTSTNCSTFFLGPDSSAIPIIEVPLVVEVAPQIIPLPMDASHTPVLQRFTVLELSMPTPTKCSTKYSDLGDIDIFPELTVSIASDEGLDADATGVAASTPTRPLPWPSFACSHVCTEENRMRLLHSDMQRSAALRERTQRSLLHLESTLQRAKRKRAEYLKHRGSPCSAAHADYIKHADFLSRQLARCWRSFVKFRKKTLALVQAYDALGINEKSVKSMPIEELTMLMGSPTALEATKALLDQFERRLILCQSASSSSAENIDHLMKRLVTPKRKARPSRDGRTRIAAKSGHGEQEKLLMESAANFVREFALSDARSKFFEAKENGSPWATLVTIFTAGIDGLRKGLKLPEPIESNPADYATQLKRLLQDLLESVESLAADKSWHEPIGEMRKPWDPGGITIVASNLQLPRILASMDIGKGAWAMEFSTGYNREPFQVGALEGVSSLCFWLEVKPLLRGRECHGNYCIKPNRRSPRPAHVAQAASKAQPAGG